MQVFVQRDNGICAGGAAEAVARAEKLCLPVARLLCRRGVDKPEAAHAFLHPEASQLEDARLLPDIEGAAERVRRAIAKKEKISVYCDYDADGICGGSALYLHVRSMGADADIFSPNRHLEGYGLSCDSVRRIAATGTTLIITVDCGITNIAEVALARELGVDVIVTDHHECGAALPDTPWLVNAKRADSVYPFPQLAGCGVAFKLICVLSSVEQAMRYIDLVAIGTITDIVPLLGENRVLAYLGMKKLREAPSPGVAALAEKAGIDLSALTSQGVSFGLGPRINAAGRMDTAEQALLLFCAVKPSPGLDYPATRICALNEQRKKEVDDIAAAAERIILDKGYYRDAALVLADRYWNPGVIGIAAARIAERFTRPCVLLGGADGKITGSARSAGGVNVYEALAQFAGGFEKFGGHAQAAGLTLRREEDADALRVNLNEYISAHYGEDAFTVQKNYDIEMTVKDVTRRFAEDMERLEPFGACNERPVVLVRGAGVGEARFVGRGEPAHLKFAMRQDGAEIDAVRFGHRTAQTFLSQTCDFLCDAGVSAFTGHPQLIVRDIAVRFDDALTEGFIEAHRPVMARRYLDELTLPEPQERGGDFAARLEAMLAESHFSRCVVAATLPVLRRLLEEPGVRAALAEGRLGLRDPLVFSLDNCVAAVLPPGYDFALYAGRGPESTLWDARLREGYAAHAAAYYMERDTLLSAYRRLCAACRRPGEQYAAEAARAMALPPEQEAFALRVLAELKLIDIDKSGRIHAIQYAGPKKALRESACYARIEDMTHGR